MPQHFRLGEDRHRSASPSPPLLPIVRHSHRHRDCKTSQLQCAIGRPKLQGGGDILLIFLLPPALLLGTGDPVLITAVKENNLSMLKSGLKLNKDAGLPVMEVDHRRRTALHWAVILDQVVMTLMLVSSCNLEAKDTFGRTPLFYAIESRNFPIALVEILLIYGARVNHVDNKKKTPMRLALEQNNFHLAARIAEWDEVTLLNLASRCGKDHNAQHSRVQMVGAALRCGIDIQVINEETGHTLLHTAAATGCISIIKLLNPSRVMAEKRDINGDTALSLAAYGGWRDVVEHLLIEWEAVLETSASNQWTPLHRAATQGHLEVVELLLERGANPLATTRSGLTPLFTACINQEDEVGALLLERISVPKAVQLTSDEGLTLARIAAARNCTKVMMRLIEYAKQNDDHHRLLSENFNGCSHAFVAVREDCQDTAMALLNAGATVHGLDTTANTALHCAARNGNVILSTWLLQHHAQAGDWIVRKNRDQHTPVQVAASKSDGYVMSAFLQHEDPKRVEGVDTAGWTALHWAAWYERLDLVRLLILDDADVRAKDSNGKTASDLVQHLETVSMELVEWLTLADTHETLDIVPLVERPIVSDEAKAVCKGVSGFLMGLYDGRTIEKAGFSIYDILYNYGPDEIMSIAAKARRIEDKLRLRWVHFPINNKIWLKDLVQSIYFDHAKSWNMDSDRSASSSSSGSTSASQVSAEGLDFMSGQSKPGLVQNESDGFAVESRYVEDRCGEMNNFGDTNIEDMVAEKHTKPESSVQGKVRFGHASRKRHSMNVVDEFADDVERSRGSVQEDLDSRQSREDLQLTQTESSVDGTDSASGQAQASYQHSKLRSFIEECLPLGSESRRPQSVAPFIKFLAVDNPPESYDTNIEGFRVGLSIPYFAFTRVRNQSTFRPAMHDIVRNPIQNSGSGVPENSQTLPSLSPVHYYDHHHKGSLHVPQTLDEFYYQYLVDPDRRAADQVLYRHQGLPGRSTEKLDRYICSVDQFWLYAVDDETIVTSCSNHLDRDMVNLQEAISTHIKQNTNTNIGFDSIYKMIPLMLALCIRKTIECEFSGSKERLLDVFAEAIARTANRHVELFGEFKEALTTEERLVKRGRESTSRDIREEIELLEEVNDILDELNIVKSVLLSQASILEEYVKFLRVAINAEFFGGSDKDKASAMQTYLYCKTLSRIDLVLEQVDRLTHDAKEVQHNLNNLLDLRQKDANLAEAIWARKASEETTRQSRTILVFTVVTIIFLPITFLSSLFALDITSFPHNDSGDLQYSPKWAFSWLIGMTIAVSIPLVLLAFFVNEITVFLGKVVNRANIPATATKPEAMAGPGSKAEAKNRIGSDVASPDITSATSRFDFRRRGPKKRERHEGEV